MQLGRVVGQAVSTVKHPSFQSWKLLLVQLLGVDGKSDGEPLLAWDDVVDRAIARAMTLADTVEPVDGAAAARLIGSGGIGAVPRF